MGFVHLDFAWIEEDRNFSAKRGLPVMVKFIGKGVRWLALYRVSVFFLGAGGDVGCVECVSAALGA